MDYNSEELHAIALLSGDTVMLDGFRRGRPSQDYSYRNLGAKKNYNVNVRKKAKAVNFLMSYQGGPKPYLKHLKFLLKEACEIINDKQIS